MTIPRICLAIGLAALLALAGGFGWRWYSTPAPPEFALDQMDNSVADAIRESLEQLRRDPRGAAAWGTLGMVALANGYRDQAVVRFVHAERFDPQDPRWPYLHGNTLLLTDPHAALPFLERAVQIADSDPQRAAIHFRLALTLFEDGQVTAAAKHVDALRAIEPDSDRARFGLALVATAQDDRQLAREQLQSLLASPFAQKQANARLAALALAEGDEALARTYQQRGVPLPADVPWPDSFLDAVNAHAAGRQNRFREAESLESQGKLREALGLYRQIAAETPDASSYLALGIALGKLQEYDEAEQVLQTVVRLDRRNLYGHYFLGAILLYRGEKQPSDPDGRRRARDLFHKAVAAEDQALSVRADHALAHQVRGRALWHLGERKEALKALHEAVVCRPEFADSHLYLGEALAEAGQTKEALVHLNDAVRLAPDDPRAKKALDALRANGK